MITRPASRPHICLRCQRRLARPFAPAAFQAAFQSTDTTSKPLDSTSSDKPAHTPPRRTALVPLSQYMHPLQLKNQSSLRYRAVEEQLGGFYGFRGTLLVKDNEPLKIDKLGKASKVIVLRESKIQRYEERKERPSEQESENVDIYARVEDERGLVGEEEVEENINAFRPEAGQEPANRAEFNDLVRRLQGGFTTLQLERYIDSHKKPPPAQAPQTHPQMTTPIDDNVLILQCSTWERLHSEFDESLSHESLRGYALASHTAKQLLVVRLLRECWELELPERIVSLVGQLEFQLRPGDLEILTKAAILDSINEHDLPQDDEHLEAFPATGVIRVTSNKFTCRQVYNRVEAAVKNIRRLKVSLDNLIPLTPKQRRPTNRQISRWTRANFSDAVLVDLSRITNTNIVRSPSKGLVISCFTSPIDIWLSTRAHITQRLLLSSVRSSDRNRHQLACKEMPPSKVGKFLKYSTIDALPWRDRLREWTRWTVPIAKDSEVQLVDEVSVVTGPQRTSKVDNKSARDVERGPKAPIKMIDSQYEGTNWWSDESNTEPSAIIGSILHSHVDSKPGSAPPTGLWESQATTIQTFNTSLPSISSALRFADLTRSTRTETVVLRFQPNPFYVEPGADKSVGSRVLSAFPPLEIYFDVVAETKELKLRSIDAIIREEGTDLMLPDQAVDVRFHQKTTSRLRKHKLDLPQIQDFLRASNLTYENRRLDLPPTITMPIARHICDASALKALGRDLKQEMYDVEYLFVDREMRSSLLLTFQNWKMVFSNIDAGKTGGRRSELSLKPAKIGSRGTAEEFMETVYNLTETIGSGAMPGPRKIAMYPNVIQNVVINKKVAPVERIFTHRAKWFNINNVKEDDVDAVAESDSNKKELSSSGDLDTKQESDDELSYSFLSGTAVNEIAEEIGAQDEQETKASCPLESSEGKST
ncbi:hypothetical protein G7Y89_g5905 [Cudoniella acicularis]|uniref:Uncharacterized protein n=1 Tax=Cudoniella acicularis TaxID=354080 RepID=A0A8H4W616_9HELO|nr:hypothetical protein G7Y89_g5905 [Cudoniella acicularis]